MFKIQKRNEDLYLKRGDLWKRHGTIGGKAKACWIICKDKEPKGLVTGGSVQSPQVNIVSTIAQHFDIPVHIHVPKRVKSPISKEVYQAAQYKKCTIYGHSSQKGRQNNLSRYAKLDAERNDYLFIPFAMDDPITVNSNAEEVKNIPDNIKSIVVPTGSGMSLIGIIKGLQKRNLTPDIYAVCAGGDAKVRKRLNKYCSDLNNLHIIKWNGEYDEYVDAHIGNIELDGIYEGKAWQWYQQNKDKVKTPVLFWIVGRRVNVGMIKVGEDFYTEFDYKDKGTVAEWM